MRKMLAAGVALLAVAPASSDAGDHPARESRAPFAFLHKIHPAGGWDPDGRGIWHWWDPPCPSVPCGPDDYCRKPLPRQRPLTCAPAGPVVRHGWFHR